MQNHHGIDEPMKSVAIMPGEQLLTRSCGCSRARQSV